MESADDHSHLIATFVEITAAEAAEAQFYLESHNFDLEAAVSTFLESNSTAAEAFHSSPSPSPPRSASPPPPPPSQQQFDLSPPGNPNPNSTNSGSGRGGGDGGRIRTFGDLRRGEDEEEGGDRPPEYYTGGEKSGMLVQDKPKNDDVDALFDRARQMGAVGGPLPSQPSSSSRSFSGTGRLLSGDTVPSAQPQHPEVVNHTITFWRNGFTVDDGPLRQFHDPENAPFLESIRNSECPRELEPADRRTKVQVSLVRRDENRPEPERRQAAFQGVGRTLGSSSSNTDTAVTEPSTIARPVTSAPTPTVGLVVNPNLPTTSIQLRLADGTRMVSRFNHHHTVRDIRGFIDAARAGGRAVAYKLQMMGFPPKELNDLDQTIEQAGLANSVVIQRL